MYELLFSKRKASLNQHNNNQEDEALSPSRASLGTFPAEIIFYIAKFLPPDSQVCLALTCHSLMRLLHQSLKHRMLSFPSYLKQKPDMAVWMAHPPPEEYPFPVRQRLLRALENKHWLYCASCLKLHRPNAFPFYTRFRPPRNRYCSLGKQPTIVDICPGYSLSFQQKRELVLRLKSEKQEQEQRQKQALTDQHQHQLQSQSETTALQLPSPSPPSTQRNILLTFPAEEEYPKPLKIYIQATPSIQDSPKDALSFSVQYAYQKRKNATPSPKPYIAHCCHPLSNCRHAVIPAKVYICPHISINFDTINIQMPQPCWMTGCSYCHTNIYQHKSGAWNYLRVELFLGTRNTRPDKFWLGHSSPVYYRSLGKAI
ncbi:hypothetical protein ARAM_005957 [Aspergillus rambellii]|uniref:F-box domain-containing protein n=1 Tax=Aspergillus rambellii TaxID=308745 RepID=A0A0F8XNB4_9EURO|nr:hypothetical protein ARAM_005957 [Aspergillus rambellii]